jgi:hypothetical protein
VAKVEFYQDDGDGVFNAVDDTKLGEDRAAAGGWRLTTSDTNGFPLGIK